MGGEEAKPENGSQTFETQNCEWEEIERMALEREIRKGQCLFYLFIFFFLR